MLKKIKINNQNSINIIKIFFHVKNFLLNKNKFSLNGILVITFLLLIVFSKVFIVHNTYNTQINSFSSYLVFILNDILLISLISIILYISFYIKNRFIRILTNTIPFFLFMIFLVDILTIKSFQSRLSLLDLYGFIDFSSVPLLFSYIGIFIIGFSIFIFMLYNLYRYIKKSENNHLTFTVILFVLSLSFFLSQRNIYSDYRLQQDILSLNHNSLIEYFSVSDTSLLEKEKTNYEDYFITQKGNNKKLNLILVFAESFSFADSKRVGGLYDNFPYFDKIQSQGITFTNVISNGCTSDNAHIAILQGVEPWYSPNTKELKGYFKYKTYTDTLPQFFNKLGFNTIFLSSAPLSFLDQRKFLEKIEYKQIVGEEKFKNNKKYTFDSAPDYTLYNNAIELIEQQTGNFFLTLQTISSHTPYYTPYGDSSKDMFEYVDKNLYGFYTKLKKSGFFDNGILVVISDHRKMQPLTKQEVDKFGKIAYAKILATVIGSGIKPNIFNKNIVQHIDFFHSIKNYWGSGYLRISSLYNDVFSNKINRDRGAVYCAYFDNKYGLVTSSGDTFKFRSDMTSVSGMQFYHYLNAYQKFQSDLFSGNFIKNEIYDLKKIDPELIILGHRGASAQAVENSLEAFKKAKEFGANGIEFDVSFTKDNQNIVSHGPDLRGTICRGNRTISQTTLQDIKKFCPVKNGESLMTLEEMISSTKDIFDYYFLEIKVYDKDKATQQAMDAINTVKKLGVQDKVIFISYDPTVNYIIGSYNGIKAGRDDYHTGSLDIIKDFSHSYYLIEKGYVKKEVIEKVSSIGKKLVVYTVNDPSEFEKLYNLGVKIFMTDDIPTIKKKFLEMNGK